MTSFLLLLLLSMQVFIVLDSQRHIILNVEQTDRILYLKAKIEEIKGIPFREQQLTYRGQCLHNDNTLQYYSIQEDTVLRLNIPLSSIRVLIKTLTGRQFAVNINPDSYIEDLKNEICDIDGTPPDQQRLIFAGRQLEDGNKLSEYSISEDSLIHLVLRLRGDKPVIYLYPEKDDFEVSVKVSMDKEEGEITSRYPVIQDNENNTWLVKANRNGELFYNERKHYYLFWECFFNKDFCMEEGFVIEGKESYEFFEEKLEYLGFKEKEANDFITYWCPKMEHSKYVLIKFQGEEYEERAPLKIEPKPDCVKRIFVTFKLLEEEVSVPIQNIDEFKIENRDGFFVLEWGGSQI